MKEFFVKHRISNKLLSLFLAACLWVIVMNTQNPTIDGTYKGLPIQLTGTEELLENKGLMVIEGQDQKVALTLSGGSTALQSVRGSDIGITVDVSGANDPGRQTFSYKPTLPTVADKDGKYVWTKSMVPEKVVLTLDRVVSKSVPVSAVLGDGASDGYLYDAPTVITQTVSIEGPQTILETIDAARVVVPVDGVTKGGTKSYDYTLLDSEGNAVESEYITRTTSKVTVRLSVSKLKTVPLTVKLIPSEEVTADMATVLITPQQVQVSGAEDVIDALGEIQLTTIDLATEQTGAERTVRIKTPPGVTLRPDQPTYAKLTLQIDGMGSRTIKTSEVTLVDTNPGASKPAVTLAEGQTIEINLRGKNSVLTAVTAADVRVTASFDSSTLSPGEHVVPVTVTLQAANSDVTILDNTPKEVTIMVAAEDGTVPVSPDAPEEGEPQQQEPGREVGA